MRIFLAKRWFLPHVISTQAEKRGDYVVKKMGRETDKAGSWGSFWLRWSNFEVVKIQAEIRNNVFGGVRV
jgi:hypothetical protein